MTDRIYDGALDLIGHTPLVRLARITGDKGAELCGKLESNNVAGSVKDRPALSMILAVRRARAGVDCRGGYERQHRHQPCNDLRRARISLRHRDA